VLSADTKGDETGFRFTFPYAALQDLRRQSDSFTDVFGATAEISGLNSGNRTTRFLYSAVTGNFFSALGVRPALGRFFEPGEGENGVGELNIVLGHSLWLKQFGGDPGVVGRQVRVDGRTATVIGIVPKDFHGVFAGADMDGYLPLRSLIRDEYSWSR